MHKIFNPPISPEALQRMSFEEKYEGFCVDLVKVCLYNLLRILTVTERIFQELSKEVKFKYEFYMVEGGGYGALKNGRWTGMIADLRSQKADMAVIDMSITSIRQTAVDFTMPYMTTGDLLFLGKLILDVLLGVGILYKKKFPPPPSPFSFLQPLSIEVWIYTTAAYLGVSISMFLLARITPYEWEDNGEGEATNQWTISNALWFGIGSFLCQGCDILPRFVFLNNKIICLNCPYRTISTRTIAIMWWFFTLIMMSSYTANLAGNN